VSGSHRGSAAVADLSRWVKSLSDLPVIVKGVQCVEVNQHFQRHTQP